MILKNILSLTFSYGFTNQLYHVSINNDRKSSLDITEGVPTEVMLRLFGKKHFLRHDNNTQESERLADLIISLSVSMAGISPKVYGAFPGGLIEEYVYVSKKFYYSTLY